MQETSTHTYFEPKTILCISAHPDDMEGWAAGSLLQWIDQGAAVYYLVLTNGDKGSADRSAQSAELTSTRQTEQKNAADLIGVKEVFYGDYSDGELINSPDVKRDIVRIIRRIQPDTVITWDPTMIYCAELNLINHTDHRACGQAALDAIYPLARDHLSFPELLNNEGLEPHAVKTALLINTNTPNFVVDITKTIDKKVQALHQHTSQFPDIGKCRSFVESMASVCAKNQNMDYAESFVRINID
ncbi:MAG TPA: PIG-L deacetylase family protein [Candidatus Saccharimonadales bacterium]